MWIFNVFDCTNTTLSLNINDQVLNMKKQIIFIFVALILFSCGSQDKQTRLAELEAQRDELNKQIEQ